MQARRGGIRPRRRAAETVREGVPRTLTLALALTLTLTLTLTLE